MGGTLIARALRLLDELPADADGIRARAVDALEAAALGDGASVAEFAPRDGGGYALRWSVARGVAAAVRDRLEDPRGGRHAFQHTDMRLARPIERRSFRSLGQLIDRGVFLESQNWSAIFEPARAKDQARLVVARDDEVVAHVALMRGFGAPLFRPAETRALQRLVEPVRRAILAADTIERDGAPSGPADLVLDARGRVRFASLEARAWLRRSGFRSHLAQLVRSADRERSPSSTHGGGLIDLVRIHGEGGRVRYLAHVTPMRRLRLAPAAALTPVQREIAALVAAGATLPEIAQMTGRSRETVRSHVKAIYERLGVASRAELARAIDS